MKNHKKIIGVVLFTVLVTIIGAIYNAFNVKAVTTPPSCYSKANRENEIAFERHFGIDAVPYVKNKQNYIKLSCEDGTFKITKITDPRKHIQSNVTTSNGYVYIDGKEAVLGGNKKETVLIKVGGAAGTDADIIKINFELTDGGKTDCDPYQVYLKKKANKQKTATYTFEAMTIDVPDLSGGVPMVENTNYNGICKAIREGVNYKNKIGSTFMKMYDSSAEAQEHYKDLVGNCFPPNNRVKANYSESSLKTLIELALESWNSLKAGVFVDDEADSSWSLNFNSIRNKVLNDSKYANHRFYTTVSGNKFYKLTSSGGKGARVSKNDNVFSQKCNYKAKSSTDFSNLDLYKKGSDGKYLKDSDGKKVYNIDANVDYYYAKSEETNKAAYHYNYSHGVKTNRTVNVCKRICEEVVEVKYGPPVASKAGLCFEYQIQVTSRVQCTNDVTAPKPEEPDICTDITPWCNNIPGHVHQGGSNLEFDACVASCDGGKYTDKCSDKCYNKVYGKSNGISKSSFSKFEPDVEKISFAPCNRANGHYEWTSAKSTIGWAGTGYATYYCTKEYSRTVRDHNSGKYVYSGGFKKANYGGGNLCKDPCYFSTSCARKSYLSHDAMEADYVKNVRAYNEAVAKCKAAATCTTKTANFKISVDYKDSDGKHTINFPYNSEAGNNLDSDENTTTCSSNPDVNNDNNILLNYGGCYKVCGTSKQYHTRWSFPGTWINSKTGEIVYKNPGNGESWKKQENKFCIPLNAKNVNTNWWNYYYHHVNSTAGTETSVNSEEFKNVCLKNSKTNTTNVTNTTSPSDSITWNIHGSTTNFGYFGWKFKFKCFYALNSNPANVSTSSSSTKDVKEKCINDTPETDYRIRSVDLTNLFPSTDGSKLSAPTAVGRNPGYNWTKYANNAKNTSYLSLPVAYTNEVQTIGYKIYNDAYLDYEFNLTPALMKKMRDDKVKYGEFKNGKSTQVRTGIVAYQSNLWRGSGVLAGNSSKVAKESVVGCNNIKNYKSDTCNNNDGN